MLLKPFKNNLQQATTGHWNAQWKQYWWNLFNKYGHCHRKCFKSLRSFHTPGSNNAFGNQIVLWDFFIYFINDIQHFPFKSQGQWSDNMTTVHCHYQVHAPLVEDHIYQQIQVNAQAYCMFVWMVFCHTTVSAVCGFLFIDGTKRWVPTRARTSTHLADRHLCSHA